MRLNHVPCPESLPTPIRPCPKSLPTPFIPESLPTPITQCQGLCVIKSIIYGLHPMIILQTNSFVFKPKYFLMLHLHDHLYTKLMCFFMGSEFLVSHRRLRTPRYFYELSPLELCLTTLTGLSPEGESILTCYYQTQVFFTTLFNRATLLDIIPLNRAHPIKCQT